MCSSDPRVYVESLAAELHGDQYVITARVISLNVLCGANRVG